LLIPPLSISDLQDRSLKELQKKPTQEEIVIFLLKNPPGEGILAKETPGHQ
jgi:hypothetical protein